MFDLQGTDSAVVCLIGNLKYDVHSFPIRF